MIQIDDLLKRALRLRAAENGQSMEEEVRQILRTALGVASPAERHVRHLEALDVANRARATRGKARPPPARAGVRQACQGGENPLSPPPSSILPGWNKERGRSSGVEHDLAKVGVEGSNPFARSKLSTKCWPRAAAG